jgi:hypothetical protein
MRFRTFAPFAVALAASLVAAGCGDNSLAGPAARPSPAAPQSPSSSSLLGGVLGAVLGKPQMVAPLQRSVPLPSNITAAARIGPLGGVLSIPSAGLTIVVPPLAVHSVTNFSVTARAGSAVAYDFEPHGIKFLIPLVATQSLAKTSAAKGGLIDPLSLYLGYYPDNSNITSVTELLDVHVDLLNQLAVSTIWHFSGYIYASGRSDGGGGDGLQ